MRYIANALVEANFPCGTPLMRWLSCQFTMPYTANALVEANLQCGTTLMRWLRPISNAVPLQCVGWGHPRAIESIISRLRPLYTWVLRTFDSRQFPPGFSGRGSTLVAANLPCVFWIKANNKPVYHCLYRYYASECVSVDAVFGILEAILHLPRWGWSRAICARPGLLNVTRRFRPIGWLGYRWPHHIV